jgi:hypothetical protein
VIDSARAAGCYGAGIVARAKQRKQSGAQAARQGAVLEVVDELLEAGRTEQVLALVSQLLTRNAELEKLEAIIPNRGHPIIESAG